MSDEASRISKTQTQQADKTATYKPWDASAPAIPTDGACPAGDEECEARTPPPPAGSLEYFCNYGTDPESISTTILSAAFLIGLLFVVSRPFSSKRRG